MNLELEKQRRYYAQTATRYDDMHLKGDPEHIMALGWLSSLIEAKGYGSILAYRIGDRTRDPVSVRTPRPQNDWR